MLCCKSDAHTLHGEDEYSRGFAFVTMRSLEDSKKAIEALSEKETFGRRLQISEPNN